MTHLGIQTYVSKFRLSAAWCSIVSAIPALFLACPSIVYSTWPSLPITTHHGCNKHSSSSWMLPPLLRIYSRMYIMRLLRCPPRTTFTPCACRSLLASSRGESIVSTWLSRLNVPSYPQLRCKEYRTLDAICTAHTNRSVQITPESDDRRAGEREALWEGHYSGGF